MAECSTCRLHRALYGAAYYTAAEDGGHVHVNPHDVNRERGGPARKPPPFLRPALDEARHNIMRDIAGGAEERE